jgi:hypothetical protein
MNSDRTAILPTAVATILWAGGLIVASVLLPITPPAEGVWWWGVAAAGTITGALALPYFRRRAQRIQE